MKILIINAGSSSIKYKLFDMQTHQPVTSGLVDRIGQPKGLIKHQGAEGKTTVKEMAISDHQHGLTEVAALLQSPKVGVIHDPAEIVAVGHRVVHGGEAFSQPTLIDKHVKTQIAALSGLAPLHNPANLTGITVTEEIFPQAQQIAVFDTAFHQTMPPHAYHYAVPRQWYKEYGVRVYGFHGTSHAYVSRKAAEHLGQPLAETNLITAHLGNGCSITAIRGGESVDTSMGLTPLDGLMMGTRSGAIDPGVIRFIGQVEQISYADIDQMLNKKSGLLAMSGKSDVRDVEALQAEGNADAKLALEMYTYRIKKYIGAYVAVLGEVSALVFTAGVGQNSPTMRHQICTGLEPLGIVLDEDKNQADSTGDVLEVQADASRLKLLVIPTDEELEIARQAWAMVQPNNG